jgi:hypothetical protein
MMLQPVTVPSSNMHSFDARFTTLQPGADA